MWATKKVSEHLKLPEDFRGIVILITRLFDEGASEAFVVSDDLIQVDNAFAGRMEGNEPCFGITYFPSLVESNTRIEPTWEFQLSLELLRRIADGEVSHLDVWRCVHDCGMRADCSEFYCGNCDLHG